LFHADGRRDMTKLIVAFRDLVNSPNKKKYIFYVTFSPNRHLEFSRNISTALVLTLPLPEVPLYVTA